MLSLIGGGMLLCAVSAMLLIALWSIARDEDPDMMPRSGILAMRHYGKTAEEQVAEPEPGRRRARPTTAKKPKLIEYDEDEMAEIEAEAAANMPQFPRDWREDY